ncbi:MAG: ferritin-like domain-containing protein [Bacteroidales bacterium]
MAKESLAILKGKIDVVLVLEHLNAALSEEWLAYYQYWVSAQVIVGAQRVEIVNEFMEHANEELGHANMIAARITELDGVPVLNPKDWFEKARCVYDAPTDFDSESLLRIIKSAEQCAMRRYQEIAELTEGKDYITNSIAKQILAEEADHEQEMQDFLDDIDTMRQHMRG